MTSLSYVQTHAETLIANALLEYTPKKIVLSYNGGKDCTVLLDLVGKVWKRFPEFSDMKLKTVYVAEKDPFPEVELFIQDSLKRFPFIELYSYIADLKGAFFKFSEETGLKNYSVLIGVRKSDPYCENMGEVQASDNGWPIFTRINPIINWSYSQIWKYIDYNNINYCKLYRYGYTSLGSRSKTQPNPALKDKDGLFLHARLLRNVAHERMGRSL